MRERVSLSPLVVPALAAALFGIARLLPEAGFGLWLRLAAASLVVLLPGRFVARCLGQRTAAAALAWSVVLVGCGLALTFALGTSIMVTLAFALAAGAVALGWLVAGSRPAGERLPARARIVRGVLVVCGFGIGGAVWFVEGAFTGDSFFHLGRIRKLAALHSLSLHDVGEFAHGGLHPGYAFPLWHGWMALVARIGGIDPGSVAMHESSILVPLALVLAFEMGWAVFRSTGAALAVVFAQVAVKMLAGGHAGVYGFLWQPTTAATQLFAPAAVALFFAFLRAPSWPLALTLAADSATLALVHPTYALFVAIPLGGFLVVRALLTRGEDLRRSLAAIGALGVPMALAFAWLEPIAAQTIAVSPGPKQLLESLHHYRNDLEIQSPSRYNLSPQRVDREGSVVLAALVLAPLALLARHRRWSALVLGGTVTILAIELWPLVFPHFSDAVSLSQSRRAAAFIPVAIAFVGGVAVVSAFSRALALLLALGCGIWLQLAYAGDFGLRAARTEPALAVWIALYGCAASIIVGTVVVWTRRDLRLPIGLSGRGITTALASFLFVLPVVVHGFSHWTPKTAHDSKALTPGLIRFLRQDAPARSVVFADLGTSYRAIAEAPVYAVAVPPAHAAAIRQNQIHKRKRAWLRFLVAPSMYEPRRWRANWLILSRRQRRGELVRAIERRGSRPVYADKRFVVFRVPAGPVPLRTP